MTEIRWKNGGPLFLQPTPGSEFGLVATEQNCCCPPPPPPRCWDCLDTCSYFIEVTSPSEVAVRSLPYDCGGPGQSVRVTSSYLLPELNPDEFDLINFAESSGGADDRNSVLPEDGISALSAGVGHFLNARPTDAQGLTVRSFSVYAAVAANVRCVTGRTPTPFVLHVVANVLVTIYSTRGFGAFQWGGRSDFDLSSTCQVASSRQCVPTTAPFHIFETPVEFTADGSTTTLGAYQQAGELTFGDLAEEAESIGQSIRDALTATFRITSRPSCQTVECSCNSLTIYGTAWTFSQGGLTREYAWGDEQAEWGDSPYYIYWDGVGTFYLTRYDPDSYVTGIGGLMTEFHVVEFGCSTINGVPTWTATITSECFQYNNVPNQTHHSTDTWVGSIECYEACPDEWHGDGAPIPIGELVDVEYLGRTTEPGYSACDPPARVTVSGRQVIAPC